MAALELRGRELLAKDKRSQLHSVQRSLLIRRPRQLLQTVDALVLSVNQPYGPDPSEPPLQPPVPETRESSSGKEPEKQKPLVRVQLSVHYRVHSRQMLCVGGSQMPFGWSFLSIAKVPMTWNQGDIWTCEVRVLLCTSIADAFGYTCPLLLLSHAATPSRWTESRVQVCHLGGAGEAPCAATLLLRATFAFRVAHPRLCTISRTFSLTQDWTKIENQDAEGVVDITYRSGSEPGRPPDIQIIQKQMAIVAWQPGPNRVVQVPFEVSLPISMVVGVAPTPVSASLFTGGIGSQPTASGSIKHA